MNSAIRDDEEDKGERNIFEIRLDSEVEALSFVFMNCSLGEDFVLVPFIH